MSREEVRQAAQAARLSLTPEEEDRFAAKLERMRRLFLGLEAVDDPSVEPMIYGVPAPSEGADAAGAPAGSSGPAAPWRPDQVRPSLPREAVLQNAPEAVDGYFKVPRVLEE